MSQIPQLRFNEFKEAWKTVKLGEISTFLDGRRKPIKEADRAKMRGVFPYYGASGIIDYVNDYIFDEEIILLGEDGENIVSRNLPLAFVVSGKCWINNHAHVIKPNVSLNIHFLTQVLENISYEKYNTGTAQPKLNQEVCRNIPVSITSYNEQNKIASFFLTIENKIKYLNARKNLLENYKKGMMQKIFNRDIRFTDQMGNPYPKWIENHLGQICVIRKGEQLNVSELSPTGLYPALNGGINPSGYTDKWNTDENTITVSEGGNSCGYINFVRQKFWSGGHCYSISDINNVVNKGYLYQFLKFNEKSIMRMRVGSGLPNIQKKALNSFIIDLPIIDEQNKIANFLNILDEKIAEVTKRLDKTQLFKKGLVQQMFV